MAAREAAADALAMNVIKPQQTENEPVATKEPKPISNREAAANAGAIMIIKILSNGAPRQIERGAA
jgi:hypothetical protein